MATMRYLDLSYEGRQLAERNQLDNGKLPHGSYRGSTKKHPPCHLSCDKGREFKDKLDVEVAKIIDQENRHLQGESPSWALLLHREPSYTDESPLIVQNYLAASKYNKVNTVGAQRQSLIPKKTSHPLRYNGTSYYRPNRLHQYLTATELKNSSEDQVNMKYGRPTRTTLLRARHRSASATTKSYESRRDIFQRVVDIKSTWPVTSSTEYLELRSLREGESLHSYLTGARYNRANCLDAKSVEHSGVFMPRNNPALGMFFRGPKGQEYLHEIDNFIPPATPPSSARRRPFTAPTAYNRGRPTPTVTPSTTSHRRSFPDVKDTKKSHHSRSTGDIIRSRETKLNVVGCRLQLGMGISDRLPAHRPVTAGPVLGRNLQEEDHAFVSQPPPTPTDTPKVPIQDPESEVQSEVGDDVPVKEDPEKVIQKTEDETFVKSRNGVEVPGTKAETDGNVSENVQNVDMTVEEEINVMPETLEVTGEDNQTPPKEMEKEDDQVKDGQNISEALPDEVSEDVGVEENTASDSLVLEEINESSNNLSYQAKELVEEAVEQTEKELQNDVQEEVVEQDEEDLQTDFQEEPITEEAEEKEDKEDEEPDVQKDVEPEEDEATEIETSETDKTTKEVRFFITEGKGEPREENFNNHENLSENAVS